MSETTLTIIKPDAVGAGNAGKIIAHLESEGFAVRAMKMVRLSKAQAKAFYEVHKERPFYGDLVKFMTSGPVVVSVLEGENAIQAHRDLLGPTNSEEAAAGTIRGDFGTDIEKNAAHGSDAPETARVEISYFFNASEILGAVEAL